MPWLLIKLDATPPQTAVVSDALTACGALSVTIESATGEERFQSGLEETALWNENRVSGLFPYNAKIADVLTAVRHALGTAELPRYEVALMDDTDWVRAWMANYRPLQAAPGLWICPSWCTPPDPDAVNVVLDPGLAFGTGTHPSTALCLTWLAAQPLAGQAVIDYGCGSGILAIAALKLGAIRAIGVDVDPQAVAASRANAARNGVDAQYNGVGPEALPANTRANIVIANILTPTLIELAPKLVRWVGPNGWIVLSGLLTEQAEQVRRSYAAHFAFDAHGRDGWTLLAGRKLT